jgi:hypothetical protein
LYIIQGYYSQVLRALVEGIGCNLIDKGMLSDIIHVCDLSFDFLFDNVCYCSVLIMVQGDYLEVLEAVAYDERIAQLDRSKIFLLLTFFGVRTLA